MCPSNTPPPPPPPLSLGGLQNWKRPQGSSSEKSSSSASGASNGTKSKGGLSNSPIQQPSFNLKESPLFRKMQEEHNANSEIADDRSFVNNRKQHSSRSE